MMKKKKLAVLLICIMAIAVLAAGCGSGGGGGTGTPQDGGGQQGGEDYTTLTFDNYGREVTVEKMPQKVLTLGPNCSELFVALGLTDTIVGNSLDNHSRGPLPEYAGEYAKIPEMNYSSATREAAISSGADFIYGIDWEFGDEGLDLAELESSSITVYMNSASSMEEIYQEITDLGKIFHVEDRAEAFIKEQKARIAAVEDAVKGEKEPVKVLVYDSGNDGVFTCGGNNFETRLIELAGGRNVFDDITDKQWTTVSYEEVLARNPDVIVIHDYDSPSLEAKLAEINSSPALAQLDCVKNQRFVPITLESVLPGDRMAYSVESLSKGFFPDLFQ